MKEPAIWFPTIRTGTGTDVFTERLVDGLKKSSIRAEVAWLPLRAEYFPWGVAAPRCPSWANIVHINSWLSQRFVPNNLPLVVTFHSSVHDPDLTKYKSLAQTLYHQLWGKSLERQSIRSADIITAVSGYAASQAKKIFRCPQIETIHNWVDLEEVSPPERTKQHSPFRLLFVGNVSRRLKGADLLAPIMELLGTDYELWITGRLIDIPGQNALPANIIELGHLDKGCDVVTAYRNSDALLFPTRSEGFGLVALEAQACGLPVIATNGSSIPEVVEDGVTGLLCPQDNIEAFTYAVRCLRHDSKMWHRMSVAARTRAISLFSESVAVEKYIELYKKVILSSNVKSII
jgi:glycosyltransferase involved in cell wall biosynthesis